MLRVPGLLNAVDVFAIHPNAKLVYHVMRLVRSARVALNTHGASAKPIWITEAGWASGTYGFFFVSEDSQARNLDKLYRELLSVRRSYKLLGAAWFCYRDFQAPPGEGHVAYAGYWGYRSGCFGAITAPSPRGGSSRVAPATATRSGTAHPAHAPL
jgi:hypothetical protein